MILPHVIGTRKRLIPPEHADDIARMSAELIGTEKGMQAFMDGGASLYDAVMKHKVC